MKRKISKIWLVLLLSFLFWVLAPNLIMAQDASDIVFAGDSIGKCQIVVPPASKTPKSKSFKASATAEEFPKVLGEQRVLVVLVEFPDALHTDNPDLNDLFPEKAEQVVFYDEYSTNAYFAEVSQNRIWLTGKALGWRMMSKSSTEYGAQGGIKDFKTMEMARDVVALLDTEVDWTSYDRLIIVTSCDLPAAFGSMGDRVFQTNEGEAIFSVVWIEGFDFKVFNRIGYFGSPAGTIAHELGHNFGLWHAGAWMPDDKKECFYCQDLVNISQDAYNHPPCVLSQIDDYDSMGELWSHFSAWNKFRLGWLDSSQVLEVKTDTVSWLDQRVLPSGGIKLIIISLGVNEQGKEIFYYLEYFKPLGDFDSQFWTNRPQKYRDTVLLRFWPGKLIGEYNAESLIFAPSIWTPVESWPDPILMLGSVFCDPDRGVSIEVLEQSGEQADSKALVRISFSCPQEVKPKLTVSGGNQNGYAGAQFSYTATIANKAEIGCGTKTYNLSANLPNGWNVVFTPDIVSVDAYSSEIVQVEIQSPNNALPGNYSIAIVAADESNPDLQDEKSVAIVLDCQRLNPSVAVSPELAEIQVGESFTWDITVANQEISGCQVRTYRLEASGQSVTLSQNPVVLNHGVSATVQMTIAIALDVIPGDYEITLVAKDSVDSSIRVEKKISFTVKSIPPPPPPPPPLRRFELSGFTDNATVKRNAWIGITVIVTEGDIPISKVNVLLVITNSDGKQVLSSLKKTNTKGKMSFRKWLSKKAPLGTWKVELEVSKDGYETFQVGFQFTVVKKIVR